jgi:hypothetical protein
VVLLRGVAPRSRNLRQSSPYFSDLQGAHRPRHLDPVFEKHERRPKLHAERSPQWSPCPVLDPDMCHLRKSSQSFGHRRRRRLAMTAPAGAKLQQHRAWRGGDLLARGAWIQILVHVHPLYARGAPANASLRRDPFAQIAPKNAGFRHSACRHPRHPYNSTSRHKALLAGRLRCDLSTLLVRFASDWVYLVVVQAHELGLATGEPQRRLVGRRFL